MTVTDPIPTTDYGKGNWQDYISNWRQKDAGWVQERSILRYATATARQTDWGTTPHAGQVTYNDETKSLEMWRAGSPGAWVRSLMFQFLTSGSGTTPVDSASVVNISHSGAAGKGVNFTPTGISIDLPVNITNGVLTTTTTAVAVQTPAMKKATLTTDSDELLSDTPLVLPGLRMTGPIDAATRAVTVGALTATSLALGSGTLNTTGAVSTGALTSGPITAPSVTISGASTINGVAFNPNWVGASGGFVSGSGFFRGESPGGIASGVLSYRDPSTSGVSVAQLTADTDYIRLRGGRGMPWHNAAGAHVAWISPVIVSGGDPGAPNYPDGTIWIVP